LAVGFWHDAGRRGHLEGMPEPKDLHRAEQDGVSFVSAGSAVLAC
jgi:hypothetical protein